MEVGRQCRERTGAQPRQAESLRKHITSFDPSTAEDLTRLPMPAISDKPRPSETPKDLKKRVRALDKQLASVHERLMQTEKQIYDLERSYLEETRLYGNVLQGWDAYLDTKEKGAPGSDERENGGKRDADAAGGESGEGGASGGTYSKRIKGVELEERLFSLGSVTSPASRILQKQREAKAKASVKQADAGGGGASGGSKTPKKPKEKKTQGGKGANKSSSKKSKRR